MYCCRVVSSAAFVEFSSNNFFCQVVLLPISKPFENLGDELQYAVPIALQR